MRAATESGERFGDHSFARAFRPFNVERFLEGKWCIQFLRFDRPAESRPEYSRGVGVEGLLDELQPAWASRFEVPPIREREGQAVARIVTRAKDVAV